MVLTVNGDTDADREPGRVLLPLDLELANPGAAVLAAAALLVAASFFGLAALQTAAVMRVLDPDRHVPPRPPTAVRRARRVLLGPLHERAIRVERLADEPLPTAASDRGGAPTRRRVRCTVLIPAHNEEAVLALHAGVVGRADPASRPGRGGRRQLHRRDGRGRPRHDGVEVVETVGNTDKKAGALNQELARVLPTAEAGMWCW